MKLIREYLKNMFWWEIPVGLLLILSIAVDVWYVVQMDDCISHGGTVFFKPGMKLASCRVL